MIEENRELIDSVVSKLVEKLANQEKKAKEKEPAFERSIYMVEIKVCREDPRAIPIRISLSVHIPYEKHSESKTAGPIS